MADDAPIGSHIESQNDQNEITTLASLVTSWQALSRTDLSSQMPGSDIYSYNHQRMSSAIVT